MCAQGVVHVSPHRSDNLDTSVFQSWVCTFSISKALGFIMLVAHWKNVGDPDLKSLMLPRGPCPRAPNETGTSIYHERDTGWDGMRLRSENMFKLNS